MDFSYNIVSDTVKFAVPDEAEHLLKSRVQVINVWQPIHHSVAHQPLAVSDWQHLDERDLVPVPIIRPSPPGEAFSLRYSPAHRWYYISAQTPEEVLIFKNYDSQSDVSRGCVHFSFVDTRDPPEAPYRESIEVRAVIVYAE